MKVSWLYGALPVPEGEPTSTFVSTLVQMKESIASLCILARAPCRDLQALYIVRDIVSPEIHSAERDRSSRL